MYYRGAAFGRNRRMAGAQFLAVSRLTLLVCSVAGTILFFLLNWAVALLGVYLSGVRSA
jgi:hypothetical protein